MDQSLRFRLTLDGAGQVQAGAQAAAAALGQVGQAASNVSAQTKLTGHQTAQLSAQLQDLFVQIQAGGDPLTALIQQGSQLSAVFGGVGNAVKAVASLVTPSIAAIGGLAAGVGALSLAYKQGNDESDAYAKSLILTGNAAGATVGHLQAMAQAIAGSVGTQGKAAEGLAQLASSGRVAAAEMARLAEASIRFERAGGGAASETYKKFVDLGRAPLQTLVKLNEAEGFLTASLYDQVKALQEQGRVSEAAAKAQTAYANVVAERAGQLEARLGSLERGWRSVADGAKHAWDAMLNVGRQGSVEEAVARAQAAVDRIEQRQQGRALRGGTVAELRGSQARSGQDLADARAYLATQEEGAKIARRIAESQAGQVEAGRALAESDKIIEASLSNQAKLAKQIAEARLTMQIAGKSPQEIERALAYIKATSAAGQQAFAASIASINSAVTQAALKIKDAQAELDAQAQRGLVSQRDYIERTAALQVQDLQNQIKALEQTRARTLAQPNSGAAVSAIDNQLAEKRLELLNREAKLRRDLVPVALAEAAAVTDVVQAFRQEELAADGKAIEQQRQQRVVLLATLQDQHAALEDTLQLQDAERQLIFATSEQRAIALEQLRIEIERKRQLRQVEAAGGTEPEKQAAIDLINADAARKKAAAVAKVYVDEFTRNTDRITSGLTDAILHGLRGGRDGARAVVRDIGRMFEELMLRPQIEALVKPLAAQAASWIPALTGTGAASGSTGWLGMVGNAGSAYSGYSKIAGLWGGGGSGAAFGATGSEIAGLSSQAYGTAVNQALAEYGITSTTTTTTTAAAAGGTAGAESLLSTLGPYAVIALALYAIFKDHSKWSLGSVATGIFKASQFTPSSFDTPFDFGNNTEHDRPDNLSKVLGGIGNQLSDVAKTFGGQIADSISIALNTDIDAEGQGSGLLSLLRDGQRIAGVQTGTGAFSGNNPGAAAKIDAAQLSAFFATSVPQLMVEALQQSDLTERFKTYFNSVAAGSDLTADKAQELLQTATAVQQFTQAVTPLGGVFKQVETASVGSVASIAKSAGGFDQLSQAVGTYYQAFYTQGERTKIATDGVSKALAGVGLAMPDLTQTADVARAQFRALVDGIKDINSESGQKTLNTLLSVSGAFDQLVSSADQARQAVASEAQGLETRLLQAQGRIVELRDRERAALDASNRALYDQVVAAEAAAKAAQERQGLETQLLTLQGKAVELRKRERDAIDESNRALYDQVKALEDFKSMSDQLEASAGNALSALQASVQAQKDALQRAYNDQVKLLDAQAKAAQDTYDEVAKQVAATRKAAQAAYDQQAASINSQLKALDEAEKQRTKEYRAAVDQVTAERKAAQTAYTAAADQLQAVINASTETVGRLSGLNDSLKSTLDSLRPLGSEGADRARAQVQIQQALAAARATGALPTAESLKTALAAISRPSEDLFGSFAAYQRDFFRTAIDIADLQKISGSQLDEAQSQLDATLALKDQMDEANKANLERLDGIREALDTANDQAREAYELQRDNLQGQLASARDALDNTMGTADAALAAADEIRNAAIDAINKQREGITLKLDADLSQLDGILDYAKKQYDAIVGIDDSVKPIPQALSQLDQALQALATVLGKGPITTGGNPGSGTGTSTTPTGQWVTSGNVQTWLDPNGAVGVQPTGNTSTTGLVLRGNNGQTLNAQEAIDFIGANIASPQTLVAATQQFGISDQGVDALMGWTAGTFAALTSGAKLKGFSQQDIKSFVVDRLGAGDIQAIYTKAIQVGINSLSLDALSNLTRGSLGSAARTAGLPSFAVGTPYVPSDMVAQIHQGERIIPATDNAELMRMLRGGVTDSAFAAMADRLREMTARLERIEAAGLATAANTGKLQRLHDRWDGDGQPPTREE